MNTVKGEDMLISIQKVLRIKPKLSSLQLHLDVQRWSSADLWPSQNLINAYLSTSTLQQ